MAIEIGKPASNQSRLELPGFSDEGAELMQEARKWRAAHHVPEWQFYMRFAKRECSGGYKASPDYCLEAVRHKYHISIPNALAAPLSRIAMEENPELEFNVRASKVDGFTDALL